MLPQKHRYSPEFEQKTINHKRTPHFRLLVFLSEHNYPRFCLSTSKKILPKAVQRNLLKRKVYSIINVIKQKIKPFDYLIIPNPGVDQLNSDQLKKQLTNLFHDFISH